jgi:hypothetical protein
MGKFTEALEVYQADPNFFKKEKHQTVFEMVLSTPKSGIFIRKCIEYGGEFFMVKINICLKKCHQEN